MAEKNFITISQDATGLAVNAGLMLNQLHCRQLRNTK